MKEAQKCPKIETDTQIHRCRGACMHTHTHTHTHVQGEMRVCMHAHTQWERERRKGERGKMQTETK